MSTNDFLTNANGLFKNVYASKEMDVQVESLKLLKLVPFVSKEKQTGNKYAQAIILNGEHGVSYGGPDDDAFTLLPAVAGKVKQAQVSGNPKCMRSLIGYSALSRSINSAGSFMDATKYVVANMLKSMQKRLEVEAFYGATNLGAIDAVAGLEIELTAASWAPGIWSGGEKMPIEIRTALGVLRGTAVIDAVDMDTKTLTLDAMPGGTIATDVIHFQGSYGNEFAGLKKIITNTGTLFNIDAAEFSLWKGNTYDAAGVLSLEKIELAIARAVEKGLDSDVVCFVNPSVFSVLVADEAALRKYDASYKGQQGENGFSKLKFHAMNGSITVEPSIYVKQGDAFIVDPKVLMRIGSSDVTFKVPGTKEEFLRQSDTTTALELRCWTDQAIFTPAPGRHVYISGVTLS